MPCNTSFIKYFHTLDEHFFDEVKDLVYLKEALIKNQCNHVIVILTESVDQLKVNSSIYNDIIRGALSQLSKSLAKEYKKITIVFVLNDKLGTLTQGLISKLEHDSGVHRFNGQAWNAS